MSFRRSPQQMNAARNWAAFVAANQERFQAAGLPLLATQSVDHWDELLMHGRFDHQGDASHFHIAGLTDDQYALLVDLVESYFLAGYEYFTPTALKPEDRARLTHRFGR